AERAEVLVDDVEGAGLQHHLELVVVLAAVGVVAVAAVLGAAAGLDPRGVPRLRSERAQEGRRVERRGAFLDAVRLRDEAVAVARVFREGQDEVLEVHKWGKSAFFQGQAQRMRGFPGGFAGKPGRKGWGEAGVGPRAVRRLRRGRGYPRGDGW